MLGAHYLAHSTNERDGGPRLNRTGISFGKLTSMCVTSWSQNLSKSEMQHTECFSASYREDGCLRLSHLYVKLSHKLDSALTLSLRTFCPTLQRTPFKLSDLSISGTILTGRP